MTQDELKAEVGRAALQYVVPGEIVGVGTGSTVNKFIDALASIKDQIPGAVSSSEASTERLKALGITVLDANTVERLSVYIDGADEIDHEGYMVKGGVAKLRMKDGQPLVTDNGQHILDVTGLAIADPLAFETEVNQWAGVITVGIFAHQKAVVCLLGTELGVQTLEFV